MKVEGGCHCGAVRFEAEMPEPPVPALDCNCSVCRMTGFLHIMVPHEVFQLLSGRDALATYRFGTGTAEHLFCRHCGIKSFYQPRSHPEAWSVNANCLDEPVELAVDAQLGTPQGRLDPAVENTAYFSVAEALTNVAKHSGASRAGVEVRRAGDRLRVRITDDGTGGATETGSGIVGIRRRVEAYDGGGLRVDSPPGGPTMLEVELPCGS